MMDYSCPNCSSQDYEINDYWDDFDDEGGVQSWNCTCRKCKIKFKIFRSYECINVSIQEDKEEEK